MRHLTRLLESACLCMALASLQAICLAQSNTANSTKLPVNGHWQQLKAHEKAALAPLATSWGDLTETHRSKWRSIAQQFDKLSASEQQIMQARMKEWVALSPVQRNQARLNFNTLQGLSKDEKKSRWDEYQALSEEEKRKLLAGVLAPTKTAAPSRKPVAADRLVQPTVRSVPSAALPPRPPIDRKTLLPIPATPSAPSASADIPAMPTASTEAASEAAAP